MKHLKKLSRKNTPAKASLFDPDNIQEEVETETRTKPRVGFRDSLAP